MVFAKIKCCKMGKLQPPPPAFEATERVVGGLPKQNGLMSPADASLGKMKRSCGKKNDTSPVLTTLGVLCCPGCLGWPHAAAHKRPWLVLSGVMTRPQYMLMAMVFLCFSLLKVIYQTSVPYDRTSRWVLGDPGPICMSGSN